MLAIRSTPRVSAIAAAAVAGACLLLSACGGGSAGGSTAGSSSSSGGGSTPAASSAASVPGLPSAKLTGHFCKDFTNLSHNLPKVPNADKNNLSALQANGGGFFKSAAAYFNGLAGEAPPQAAAELKIIASAYSSVGSGSVSASSVDQLEKQMESITTKGKTGQAFIGLVTYLATHCH
jgi:hypothetical protein